MGPNLAESRNLTYPGWIDDYKAYISCRCNTFKFPVEPISHLIEDDPYTPHRFDPLKSEKLSLLKLSEESDSQEFSEGVVKDLKASMKLPHYARVMLKIKSDKTAGHEVVKDEPENQIDNEEDEEGYEDVEDQEEYDDEADQEQEEYDDEADQEEDQDNDTEHDYTSCKNCLKVLSAQVFHGHLAKSISCKNFYLEEFTNQKFNKGDMALGDVSLYTAFREFVNDDRKRISRFRKKIDKTIYQTCTNCGRNYVRMGVHDKQFLGCKSSKM